MIYNNEDEHMHDEEDDDGGVPFSGDEEEPIIGLVGDITEESAQQVAMMLLNFNGGGILRTEESAEQPRDLEFFISSGGGSVSDMFTIYDLMSLVKSHRDIATFGYGKIASAAVPLLAAGTKGKRYMAKHARLMIHHCATSMMGTVPTVRANYEELRRVEDMMVEVLAENSGLSAREVYEIFSRNTDEYFSAEDALEMGIVDKII